jgi:hypothetical protein
MGELGRRHLDPALWCSRHGAASPCAVLSGSPLGQLLLPITIRFSKLVADIMREVPKNREPLPQFKFYI